MLDGKPSGVQGDSPPKCPAAAVFSIADDGMTRLGELQSDLMFSAGMQFDLDQR